MRCQGAQPFASSTSRRSVSGSMSVRGELQLLVRRARALTDDQVRARDELLGFDRVYAGPDDAQVLDLACRRDGSGLRALERFSALAGIELGRR